MPRKRPPRSCPGIPVEVRIRKGTRMWRVHPLHRDAVEMNPSARPDAVSGGRFDSIDGSYAYIYLGNTRRAALAEPLTRDLPLDGGPRLVPHKALQGRRLSEVEVTRNIAGFSYRARHDEDQIACVLFTAPAVTMHPRLTATGTHLDLDGPQGRALTRSVLSLYNATLAR